MARENDAQCILQAGFANVAEIDCRSNEKLCTKLGVEYGTRYFAAGEVKKGKAVVSNPVFCLSCQCLCWIFSVHYQDATREHILNYVEENDQ